MLKILISDERKLIEIQKDFNSYFPFLKLEFFKAPHKIGEGSSKSLLLDANKLVREIRNNRPESHLEINSGMTVNQLELLIFSDFGLAAQVFRKSGNVWLETSATDNWTLLQQNNEGAELSTQIKENRENLDNIDPY
ncbi:MAG: hypothetical protein IPO63_07635 [Bacteroidetes bacterium]|nr:hypothetical protein [Bacteroidota bacterium]